MAENSLHAGLKNYLQLPGDKIEYPIESYIIDIVRENTLFEIQTKNFYALKPKLSKLLANYPIHIVYPIPLQKWIRRLDGDKIPTQRRKSPKHGSIYHIFNQLVYLTDFLAHSNLFIDVFLIEQEDIWLNDGKGSWRRKGWSLTDQHLLRVVDKMEFSEPGDYIGLIPQNTPEVFRNIDLAASAKIPVSLAGKMTYTLLRAGILAHTGKAGKTNLFSLKSQDGYTVSDNPVIGQ